MKPLHVGLLVIGAALAGGLAVKMTQAPPMPAAAPAPIARSAPDVPAESPVPSDAGRPAAEVPVTSAPPPVYAEDRTARRTLRPAHAAAARPHPFAPRQEPPNPRPAPPVETAHIDTPPPINPAAYQAPIQPAANPEPVPPAAPSPEPLESTAAPAPPPQRVTLEPGMAVSVRLDESVSSERAAPGDIFRASLAEPLVVEGLVIAERGARVTGRVTAVRKAGRMTGTAMIELVLSTLQTADGQKVAISTDTWSRQGASAGGDTAMKAGGGAVLGAIVGALAGGGKGAAIGSGAGGGLGAAAATHGKPVDVPSETLIRFRLNSRMTLVERKL